MQMKKMYVQTRLPTVQSKAQLQNKTYRKMVKRHNMELNPENFVRVPARRHSFIPDPEPLLVVEQSEQGGELVAGGVYWKASKGRKRQKNQSTSVEQRREKTLMKRITAWFGRWFARKK